MQPITRRQWIRRGEEALLAGLGPLCAGLDLSPLVCRALLFRGITSAAAADDFLNSRLSALPDPFLMPGIEEATERIVRAISAGEKIVVHGDYDVDGVTGTVLLVESLRAFGGEVEYHIPLRLRDGYGISARALHQAADAGVRLIISVDCGISAVVEAALARDLGLDLIITDHHHIPESLPEAVAIVHPALPGSRFPFHELAGVGVAFFLLVALRKRLRERGTFSGRPEPDLRRSLDLVAMGSIADVVPLRGVNRLMTRTGLALIASGRRPGLEALKKVASVQEVSCGAVAFRLAPRLNAAGRLEDAGLGVELLLAGEAVRAQEIAGLLDDFNRERQQIEEETLRQAIERLEQGEGGENSIVLADTRWHSGVLGIVASRLTERYHRPAVLIALRDGKGKGSARSIPGFHLYQALHACAGYLEGYGGHACAAGLTIGEDRILSFTSAFEEVACAQLSAEDLQPRLHHDGEILLSEINEGAVREIALLAPFGAGNPEPAFVVLGVCAHQVRPVGRNHLRFVARKDGYSFPCIAFGFGGREGELQGELDLLFTPILNEWRGSASVQLRIKDWRAVAHSPPNDM